MKTIILLGDGVKQIMFTPETENERNALKMITVDDNIHTVIKRGNFYNDDKIFGANIEECQGGYYRAYDDSSGSESVMFVLTPKKDKKTRIK